MEKEINDFKHLGEVVKFLRKYKKMTQIELAKKLNKTPYTIKRYEKNGKIPLEVVKEIFLIFEVSKTLAASFISNAFLDYRALTETERQEVVKILKAGVDEMTEEEEFEKGFEILVNLSHFNRFSVYKEDEYIIVRIADYDFNEYFKVKKSDVGRIAEFLNENITNTLQSYLYILKALVNIEEKKKIKTKSEKDENGYIILKPDKSQKDSD